MLFFRKVNYSLQSLIFQPIFWHVSFNIIKYKEFFDQYGFHIPSKDLNEEVRNSYKRAVLFYRNDNLVRRLIINLRFVKSHLIMILWIIISVLRKKENQIWIDKFIITNYRYNHPNLKKIINDSRYLEVLNKFSSPTGYSYRRKNFFDGLKKEILTRIFGYKLWSLAIKYLKPKKIIVRDDLENFQGILLAAKINKVEIIGINHGPIYQYVPNLYGPKSFCILNPIIFDKLYVWHTLFISGLIKNTTLYNSKQVKFCGWLQKFNYNYNNNKNNSNKYVLYPFEHHTNFLYIKELLIKFINLGKKVIVKKYPGWNNYEIFENMDIELVDNFSSKHLDNTFVVVGLTTVMVMEFISKNYLVIYPSKSGYNFFKEYEIATFISDKEFFENKKDIKFDFKLEEITNEFKMEFN